MTSPVDEHGLEALLGHLQRTRNCDFTGYKRGSLARRIGKRMQTVGVTGFDDYIDYLEVHPDEFDLLFDTVLINVTSFFRDREAWDALADLLRQRMAERTDGGAVRLWSAGTASGEEAYSLAIVMAELLGEDEFKRRVKIYGTDIDEQALGVARHAVYSGDDLDALDPVLRAKYFEPVDGRFAFRSDLRRGVIFGRHDLVQDAPISKLDLLACRNTLMYLNTETQSRILERFHFAVSDDGILFLGQAETLLAHSGLYRVVDLRHHIFAKDPAPVGRPRDVASPLGRSVTSGNRVGDATETSRLASSAFDAGPVPTLVVEATGRVAAINRAARHLFGLRTADVGRPFQDLELSFRPVELRSCIEAVRRDRRPIVHREAPMAVSAEETLHLDVEVMPLSEGDGDGDVIITFADVSHHRALQDQLADSKRQLEAAYEELQSTNEELETTNEELQSTIEELETTNEELQSTNEELETMNEELQSTNDEVQAVNEELRIRGGELNDVNAFLESMLSALNRAVVVLDTHYVVQVWNDRAEDLWGLRREEVVARPFFELDFGLPVETLRAPILSVTEGRAAIEKLDLTARNRRGRRISCEVVISPRSGPRGEVAGALLLMHGDALDAG
jgi:two-component system, chemotaxis family, CheB/CheR fusion protein